MKNFDKDVLFEIFTFLNLKEIFNFCLVNKYYCENIKQNYIWKQKLVNIPIKKNYDAIDYFNLYKFNHLTQKLNNKGFYLKKSEPNQFMDVIFEHQEIKQIPPEIFFFTNIFSLNLSYNNIRIIPKQISELKNLNYLNLCNNRIKNLPLELDKLKDLRELLLFNNDLKKIPKALNNLRIRCRIMWRK